MMDRGCFIWTVLAIQILHTHDFGCSELCTLINEHVWSDVRIIQGQNRLQEKCSSSCLEVFWRASVGSEAFISHYSHQTFGTTGTGIIKPRHHNSDKNEENKA